MQATTTERYEQAKAQLEQAGQGHVLRFYDELDDAGKAALLDQVDSVDWPELARLVQTHVLNKPAFELPQDVKPAPWYPYEPTDELSDKYDTARTLGEKLIRDGKVAAFTVAGGQGTRLGWPGPKGTFPATAIRRTPLFALFAEFIHKVQNKYACTVPWYVMTSPVNDADTRAFFKKHSFFGLDPKHVMIFPQSMLPAIDMRSGKVLLEDKGQIALSPNGHGGSLKALYTSGAIADMQNRGVEQVSYIQVDNPIVRVIDPLFLGLHAMDRAQMSSKMLPKREPLEKLGNFCLVDGKMTVIEYSDLPDELAHERLPDGQLRFRAGSIALHAIRVDFIEQLNRGADGIALPFHRAEKKVPFLDLDTGQAVKPDKPNAVKLEMFVFDALPMCERSIIYETNRLEEFAPIKNADGPAGTIVADSPASSIQQQSQRNGAWLEKHAVTIPRDGEGNVAATLEISPLTAVEDHDLIDVNLPDEVKPGERLLL